MPASFPIFRQTRVSCVRRTGPSDLTAGPEGAQGRDHRSDQRQDADQCAELAAPMSSWPISRMRRHPLGTICPGPGEPRDHWLGRLDYTDPETGKRYEVARQPAVLLVRPRGWHLPSRTSPLLASLWPEHFSISRSTSGTTLERHWAGLGPIFLSAEARGPSRGGAVERRLRLCRGQASARARHDQSHGADRDYPRGVRDGRDPLCAAREYRRSELRPLGLYLQLYQAARSLARPADPRPVADDHG